jgi:hypothetical protein
MQPAPNVPVVSITAFPAMTKRLGKDATEISDCRRNQLATEHQARYPRLPAKPATLTQAQSVCLFWPRRCCSDGLFSKVAAFEDSGIGDGLRVFYKS